MTNKLAAVKQFPIQNTICFLYILAHTGRSSLKITKCNPKKFAGNQLLLLFSIGQHFHPLFHYVKQFGHADYTEDPMKDEQKDFY